MVQLRPFAAFRPPGALVERVACPPYDVISTAEARAFARGNADSFLRVTRPEIDLPDGTDEHAHEVYATGARNLLELCERRVLVRDAEPHLYVYAESMGGQDQVGVVGCASVRDYQRDRIRKHEKTRQDKEDDRAKHIEWLCAHDEPVFLTYRASALEDSPYERRFVIRGGPPQEGDRTHPMRHRAAGARLQEPKDGGSVISVVDHCETRDIDGTQVERLVAAHVHGAATSCRMRAHEGSVGVAHREYVERNRDRLAERTFGIGSISDRQEWALAGLLSSRDAVVRGDDVRRRGQHSGACPATFECREEHNSGNARRETIADRSGRRGPGR